MIFRMARALRKIKQLKKYYEHVEQTLSGSFMLHETTVQSHLKIICITNVGDVIGCTDVD